MNNKKVVFYIGCNDKDTHKQEKSDNDIMQTINKCLSGVGISGATITRGLLGIYNNEQEKSIQVLCYFLTNEQVVEFCEKIKKALNQEAVAVEIINNIQVQFL